MISLIFSTLEDPRDREFMVGVYLEYKHFMFSIAKGFFPDWGTQEDVVQDSLVKMMEKIDILKQLEKHALIKYIETTVKRTAINEKKKAENRRVQVGLPTDCCTEKELSEERIDLIYRKNMLVSVWSQLSKEDRILLESKYVTGNSNKEIAEFFHCKAESVRMMLTRARRNTAKLMEDNGYDET